MSKISEAIYQAGGNLARPSRFSVLIAPPAEVTKDIGAQSFDILCKSIKIPEIAMEPIDIIYKGHTLKYPGRVNQQLQLEVTLYLDENHAMRAMFHDWISGIDPRYYAVSSAAGATVMKSRNILGNMIIKARDFNETLNEPQNYFVEGIYPINVSGVDWGSASVGEISEITITFAFYRFLSGKSPKPQEGIDDALDIFGIIPKDFNGFGTFSEFANTAATAWSSVNSLAFKLGSV